MVTQDKIGRSLHPNENVILKPNKRIFPSHKRKKYCANQFRSFVQKIRRMYEFCR